jgi:integrase
MASAIWIDKEKRWSLRVTINGKLRRFTSSKPGQSGKREVLRKYREFIDGRSSSPIMVVDAWQQFIDTIILKNGKTDAFINLDKYGRNYILPKIGKMLTRNVTAADLQNIILTAVPVSGKSQLSRKTLSNLRASIMQFVRFCISADYMDPIHADLFIPKTAPKPEKVILQPDAVKRLFDGPARDWYINIFRFGCITGLRTGEILGIQETDIENDVLTVRRSINVRNELTPGKTETARRQIYLNSIARAIIDENINRNKPLSTPWVFCSKSGGPLSQSTLRNAWIKTAADRNLPGSVYSLRHTFISMMKNEMPAAMLRQIVGHTAKTDTVGIYGHVVDGELKRAANIVDVSFKRLVDHTG